MKLSRTSKKGRVFYKYLTSYFLILLIPVVMSFFLFNRASNVLTAEANRANDLLLNQIKSYFDMIMRDVHELRYLVGYNDRLEGLLYESLPIETDEYYRAYQVVNNFHIYKVATSSIADFYVYVPSLDMVMSPRGYLTSQNYHSAWMSRLSIPYEEWLAEFSSITRAHYAAGVVENESNAVLDTIRVVYPLPPENQSRRPRAWLSVHINAGLFGEILKNTAWTDESVVLVYHDEYGVIASSKTEQLNLTHSEFVPARRAGRDQVEINETRYVLLAENSDVASWSYLSLVPLDIYADRFTDLSRFTIIAFIACMLLGGLSIYWFAVARYRPVHNLLELLQPNDTGSVSVQSDEFAVITATLEMTLAEDKLLRQEVRRTKPIIAQRYLQELLKARIKDDRDARVELEKLGVVFEHPYLTVVLVEVEAIDGSDAAAAVPVDRDLPGEVYLLRDIDGAFCAIVNHDSWSTANVAETLLRNKRAAESQYPLVWSVGLSETASRSADISQLYRHARRALDFRLVKGRNAPILYELIRSSNQSYYYPIQQETKLMNSIRAGDSQIAAAIIEDIYAQNFTDTPLSLEMARCLMFDLIATMVKTVNSIVTPEEDGAFWGRVRPITRLMKCNSLEHLKTEIGSTLLQTCAYVLEHRTSHTDQLRRDILAYIHEHYADPNLCTDQVAAALNRNSAYLARFFREQMHVGMSNYIKKRRVEAAKQALRQEDVTLNELAGRVGFGGSNALIRAFKDTEGITPGQFRESITV